MKKFNIVKQDVILFEKYHIPINACFGCFPTAYKKYVGTKQIVIKENNNGFKGMKMIEKKQYKTVSENIIYYVDNFQPIKFADCQGIRIHIYDINRDKWVDTHTQAHPKYKQLHIFLLQMFVKNDIQQNRVCKYWLDYKTGVPKEKKAQVHSDSIYRASVGYALSKNVMTCHNINRDGWNGYDKVRTSSL